MGDLVGSPVVTGGAAAGIGQCNQSGPLRGTDAGAAHHDQSAQACVENCNAGASREITWLRLPMVQNSCACTVRSGFDVELPHAGGGDGRPVRRGIRYDRGIGEERAMSCLPSGLTAKLADFWGDVIGKAVITRTAPDGSIRRTTPLP